MAALLAQVHHEPQAGLPALLVLVMAILVFHGSVYVVVALNTGWRFGYWLTGATFGGLAFFLSLFWFTNVLGPRGEEPRWFPLATSGETIDETEFNKQTFTTPADYPDDPWRKPPRTDPIFKENDSLKASLSNCLSFDEKKIESTEEEIAKLTGLTRTLLEGRFGKEARSKRELETCKEAYSLVPTQDSPELFAKVPKIDGQPVTVVFDPTDIRFSSEAGVLLGQATIVPNTYDKRVTGDPEGKKALRVGEPIRVLAYRDPGSLRYPTFVYLVLSSLWFAFHLWGLNRAERRKLSPVAA